MTPVMRQTTLIDFLKEGRGFDTERPKERGILVRMMARYRASFCPETRVLLVERDAHLTSEEELPWVPVQEPEATIVPDMAAAVRLAVRKADAWFACCSDIAAIQRGEQPPPPPSRLFTGQIVTSIIKLVDQLRVPGHDGDEESGQHDEDCQACVVEALKAAVADLTGG